MPSHAQPEPLREGAGPSAAHRAVVVGYGPVGRAVTRLLRENEIIPTVIEMNVDTVRALRADGIHAIYGDATHRDVLAAGHVGEAASFIVSVAGLAAVDESFRLARQLNPAVQILARATHLREVSGLRAAGADTVVSGEGEVALAFTAAILERLGATPEQIAATERQMAEFKVQYQKVWVNAAYTFMEPFPVGLVVTVISGNLSTVCSSYSSLCFVSARYLPPGEICSDSICA